MFTRDVPPEPSGIFIQLKNWERVEADLVYAGKWRVDNHQALHDLWKTRESYNWVRDQPRLVVTGRLPALTRIELQIDAP